MPAPADNAPVQLTLALDAYEGPLDLLLQLAREQKLDLLEISMTKLAQQYLDFIAQVQSLRMEIAADYLVMAAWLALLKSRLLLPEQDEAAESAEEMAETMRLRLQHLDALRTASKRLWQRPILGRELFACGQPQGLDVKIVEQYKANLHTLLVAYAQLQMRNAAVRWARPQIDIVSIEHARAHLRENLGRLKDWTDLEDFWLGDEKLTKNRQMALAGGYAASLELVRAAELELRQKQLHAPVHIRRRSKQRAKA